MNDITYSQAAADPAAAAGIGIEIFIFVLIFFIIGYALGSWLLGRIFKKAGVASWKAWVPIYSSWVQLEIGGQKGFWILLAFIPVVNIVTIVFYYMALYTIGLKLGKSGAFVLLGIFLPIVWLVWLAFDDSKWLGADSSTVAATDPPYQPPALVPAPGTSEQLPVSPLDETPTNQNNTPPSPPPLVQ